MKATANSRVGPCSRFAFLLLTCSVAASSTLFVSRCAATQQSAPPGVVKQEPAFRKRTFTAKSGAKMPYRLFVPPQYDSAKKYPLVFWFHGGDGRGADNERQISGNNEKGAHLWTTPQNQPAFPAFVLAPQCPTNDNWSDPELNELNNQLQMALDILAVVRKDYSIDPDRISLVGQSMGGLAVWTLLQKFPEQWAAAVVVGSYDNFTNPLAIARVPLWIFQSEMDRTVPVDLIRQMVKQLKKAGSSPRYTEYRRFDGEPWQKAFDEAELDAWLSNQKRGPQTHNRIK